MERAGPLQIIPVNGGPPGADIVALIHQYYALMLVGRLPHYPAIRTPTATAVIQRRGPLVRALVAAQYVIAGSVYYEGGFYDENNGMYFEPQRYYAAFYNGSVHLLDFPASERPPSTYVSPNGRFIAVGDSMQTFVRLYNLHNLREYTEYSSPGAYTTIINVTSAGGIALQGRDNVDSWVVADQEGVHKLEDFPMDNPFPWPSPFPARVHRIATSYWRWTGTAYIQYLATVFVAVEDTDGGVQFYPAYPGPRNDAIQSYSTHAAIGSVLYFQAPIDYNLQQRPSISSGGPVTNVEEMQAFFSAYGVIDSGMIYTIEDLPDPMGSYYANEPMVGAVELQRIEVVDMYKLAEIQAVIANTVPPRSIAPFTWTAVDTTGMPQALFSIGWGGWLGWALDRLIIHRGQCNIVVNMNWEYDVYANSIGMADNGDLSITTRLRFGVLKGGVVQEPNDMPFWGAPAYYRYSDYYQARNYPLVFPQMAAYAANGAFAAQYTITTAPYGQYFGLWTWGSTTSHEAWGEWDSVTVLGISSDGRYIATVNSEGFYILDRKNGTKASFLTGILAEEGWYAVRTVNKRGVVLMQQSEYADMVYSFINDEIVLELPLEFYADSMNH
jgi:hypothetical protein